MTAENLIGSLFHLRVEFDYRKLETAVNQRRCNIQDKEACIHGVSE